MPNVQVQNGLLPQGLCPPDLQSLLNAFSLAQFVNISSVSSGFVASASPPADHTVGWLQLDSSGRPVRLYFFAQGAWLSPHPLVPGHTTIWPMALPSTLSASNGLINYDGGDAANSIPYSATSGAMWQLCSTALDGSGTRIIQARSPMGVGTLPSGALVNVNDTGGEETHKLTLQELFPHGHFEGVAVNRAVPNGGQTDTSGNGGFVGPISLGGVEEFSKISGGDPATGNPPTNSLGHNTLSLYYGVYFLQRTSRLFYVVNP